MTDKNKRSGGADVEAGEVKVDGDVVGRDKTSTAVSQKTIISDRGIVVLGIIVVVALVLVFGFRAQNSGQNATATIQPAAAQSTSSLLPDASNLVKQFDLETDTTGWKDVLQLDAGWSNGQTFKNAAIPASVGEHGLGYDLRINAGSWLNYVIRYSDPIQADVIVARFYLPNSSNLDQNWIGIQVKDSVDGPSIARTATPIALGEWTELVLDLRGKYDTNDQPLSSKALTLEVFYGVKGKDPLTTDTVRARLADVAWYKNVGEVAGAQLEQRGTGHMLYDFENERLDWQVSPTRVPTDTVELAYSQVAHRGKASLKLNTHLANGENTFISTVLNKFVPHGGWIANIYLPEEPPRDTKVWASLYTYSQSDWQDSDTLTLAKGWNTILWDTHAVKWGDKTDITVGIQIGADGGEYNGPVYIDDVQVFEQ